MATEHPLPPDPSEPAQPDRSASAAPSGSGSKPETGIERKAPYTLLLRPQSAVIEEHLGLLAFRMAGVPADEAPDESAARQALPTTTPLKNPKAPDPSPSVCVLAFQRFDWKAGHPGLLRFLGDVVRWASSQSMPMPSRVHPMSDPRVFSRVPTQPPGKTANQPAGEPFEQRALWVLIRDVTTAYVVAVDDRSHKVSLLPCPSIRKGVVSGSLDAAATWLPERWLNHQFMALLHRLRDTQPPGSQKSFVFDDPA